ncbi:M14 family metallopeptidase [Vibrio sp. WJH972]
MSIEYRYPIGSAGHTWNDIDKGQWLEQAKNIQRSYKDDIVDLIQSTAETFSVTRYGALTYDPDRYQLYCLKSSQWDDTKPIVLITGGVHGYETSGVIGALEFAQQHAQQFSDKFNFLIFPCISPWAYETVNRWNPQCIDPNRSFYFNSPSEEASNFIHYIEPYLNDVVAHFDLHETTDTDATIFRPAAAARDGREFSSLDIPDGFYVVTNSELPVLDFHSAIINAVANVTHIAQPDENGRLIGTRVQQPGIIQYAMKPLGLCGGVTPCLYSVTTEVYPDSKNIDDETCVLAQVTAIQAGLTFLKNKG